MFERARKRRSTRKQESSDGSDYENGRHRNDFNITNSSSGDDNDVEYRPRITDRGESSSSGRKRARYDNSEPQGQFTHYILETRINIEHGLKSVERTVERALRSDGLSEDAKTVCEINDSIVRRKLNKLRDYCSQIPRNAPNEN